jgi:hypothetical protein
MTYHLTDLGDLLLGVVMNQKPPEDQLNWLRELIQEILQSNLGN